MHMTEIKCVDIIVMLLHSTDYTFKVPLLNTLYCISLRGVKTSLLSSSGRIISAKAKQTLKNTCLKRKSHLFSNMLLIGFIFCALEGP